MARACDRVGARDRRASMGHAEDATALGCDGPSVIVLVVGVYGEHAAALGGARRCCRCGDHGRHDG